MDAELELKDQLRIDCKSKSTSFSFYTDGPKTIQGIEEAFSPTDLVAVSLGSCIMTMMNMCANRFKLDISGTKANVTKEMDPMRSKITKITVLVDVPHTFAPDQKEKLEKAAYTCPVHHSLHPDIEQNIQINFHE